MNVRTAAHAELLNERILLTENYAAAYQTLKFHVSENPTASNQRIDSIFKYLSSSVSLHKTAYEAAARLFERNFTPYKRGLHTVSARTITGLSKPQVQFKSGLKGDTLLNIMRPLSCRKNPLEGCRNGFSSRLSQNNLGKLIKTHWKKKETVTLGEKSNHSNDQQVRCEKRSKLFRSLSSTSSNLDTQDIVPKERRENDNFGAFVTAKTKLQTDNETKNLKKKSSINNPFICPLKRDNSAHETKSKITAEDDTTNALNDERLKNIDEKMIELIKNEIMCGGALIGWDDVAGLNQVKRVIQEIVVFPMLRPDVFTGLRNPPKGILLFGPPGTGKTLIGKCIASQSKSTFFSISASSLTSKWVGEGEKMVRALFAVARVYQPSVVFIDEIDSLLTQRSETEHESSRRIKTEFLVQLDGATTDTNDRVLIVGATNRPQELDEAARRRFVKRLYIPLPEHDARKQIINNLLKNEQHNLTPHDIDDIARLTHNYSGADVTNLCKEASMEPIRSIPFDQLEKVDKNDIRPLTCQDFHQALAVVRPSVAQSDLGLYIKWNQTYGCGTTGNT